MMGSHLLEVLRQGVWASLTGGWFHEPRQPVFINTVHMYLWIFLLAFPLTLCIYFTSTPAIWTVYCATVGMVFLCVKALNLRLHYLFDTTEPVPVPDKDAVATEEVGGGDKGAQNNRSQNVGLNESNGIEMQDMTRARTVGGGSVRLRNSILEDAEESVIGTNLKVDVHRKESSSSDSSCSSGVSKRKSRKSHRNDEKIDIEGVNVGALETVVVHDITQGQSLLEADEERSWPSSAKKENRQPSSSNSGTTREESTIAKFPNQGLNPNPGNVLSLDSGLSEKCAKEPKLKETTSLELGTILSHSSSADPVSTKRQAQFRRTQSVVETSTSGRPPSPFDFESDPEDDGKVYIQIPELQAEMPDSMRPLFHIGSKEEIMKRHKLSAEPSSKHIPKGTPQGQKGSDSDSKSESDDEHRSRTPLLARQSSLEPKPSADQNKNPTKSHGKRVSFSARSLDCTQHYYHPPHKGRSKQYDIAKDRDNRVGREKKRKRTQLRDSRGRPIQQRSESAAEVGSLVQSDFPANSTPSVSSVPASVSADNVDNPSLKETKFALVPQSDSMFAWNLPGGPFSSQWMFQAVNVPVKDDKEINEQKDGKNCDADSVASFESERSNSLVGLSRLFSSHNDLCNVLPGDESKEAEEGGGDEATSGQGSLPADEIGRFSAVPPRPTQGVLTRKGSGSRRGDRETRVLERLLEESQDQPSAVAGAGGSIDDPSTSHRRGSGRRTRRGSGDRDSPVPSGPPFLHSAARELKLQLRSLGQQNSLDIAGSHSSYNARVAGSSTRGSFRPREESMPQGDSDMGTGVNRHKRLMRLTNSRRSLERRREMPFSSPPYGTTTGSGTHVANNHDDTTEGAIHYYQDERGNWHSYTFSEKGRGSSTQVNPNPNDPSSPQFFPAGADNRTQVTEPRQGTSGAGSVNFQVQGIGLKTPSSSESWSSGSSTELAVDTTTNKMYASYRRNTLTRTLPSTSHNTSRNQSQTDSGCPSPIASIPSLVTVTPEFTNSVSGSVSSHALGPPRLPMASYSSMQRSWQRNRRDVLQVLTESLIERRRHPAGTYNPDNYNTALGVLGGGATSNTRTFYPEKQKKAKKSPRQYYMMKLLRCIPGSEVKVWFDRLKLMALFDRNRTILETFLAVILAVGVASFGAYMLHQEYCQELRIVVMCFVMATCQFSLLKSVQPDAASPTHGFNRIVAFSRPIYFCICGCVVYILQTCLDSDFYNFELKIYGVDITQKVFLINLRDALIFIVLCFPILFSLGLFPQINTFLMYFFEQIDMHGFGGNATSSLSSAFTNLLKSWIAIGLLYGFSYGALSEVKATRHLMFSIFCALLVLISYHLSRSTSDTTVTWSVLKQLFCPEEDCFGEPHNTNAKPTNEEDQGDPLPKKLKDTVTARLKSDAIICSVIGLITFGLHSSTVFSALQPGLTLTLWILAIVLGFFLHYLVPQFRRQLPFLLVSHPVLPPAEYHQFEVHDAAKLMWFEKLAVWLCFFERNIVYPLLFISALTEFSSEIVKEERFGLGFGSLIVVVCGLKALRTSFSDPGRHYLILFFTMLFFKFDWSGLSETFLVDLFFMSIAFHKVYELWLKLQFVITYIAPWQITWGSAFHAFAQPFSVPHSAMLFLQAIVSSFLSAPLNPFLGSAIFVTSYVRPIKFWEKDYNTKRVDHSNTRLSTHLEKNPGADDNNLNSIFYEHLTRSLQDCLCGDLMLGRWGQVEKGDCFVLASDYLNCLVHIIEVGNGLVTFQMRGLEFRGTYCQQREVEAISEGVEDDDGFCCCEPGHPPHMLSVNSAFSQRWLAWEVTVSKYVLEGYGITDNSAVSMLQVYDLRKILITYYVKSIIFYAIKSDKLEEWLTTESIVTALKPLLEKNYAELDPVFSPNIDEDFDYTIGGITRQSFCHMFLPWIQYCIAKKSGAEGIEYSRNSPLVSLCFGLSILGRRALGVAAHSNALSSVEFFLYGLHALFKGDFRITCQRDEWVFCDMDLLKNVVSAAVRMSLKLHQDHFLCPDEYDDMCALYDAITYHNEHLVISHEGDPAWRSAVLSGTPALLALRHVLDDGTDEYKIIMLNKRHLSFRVIKLNRECVRGLWAGQQQELVYLRNRDPERGSIQNAKQALRNIINSSCDQPIGYPIYVSPLTTSFADTHPQLCALVGGPASLSKLRDSVIQLWRRIRLRVGEGCSSGSAIPHDEATYGPEGIYSMAPTSCAPAVSGLNLSGSQSLDGSGSQVGGSSGGRSSLSRNNFNRGSVASNVSKPSSSTLASLAGVAGFLSPDASTGSNREKERAERGDRDREVKDKDNKPPKDKEKSGSLQRVRIVDANLVYDGLNLGRRIDVIWPDENMRFRGGRSFWQNWVPEDEMEGVVVHKWIPSHRDPQCRSVTDKTILLLQIDDKYVPIAEAGVAACEREV